VVVQLTQKLFEKQVMHMKHFQSKKNLLLTLCTFIALQSWSFLSVAEVSVIVHKDNNASLDKKAISKLYLGKSKKFDNGRTALLLNAAKGSPVRDEFNKKVIGRSSSQMNAHWSKLVFTGKGTPPKEIDSSSEIVSTVAENKDTIGYVESSAVTDAVKVIATF